MFREACSTKRLDVLRFLLLNGFDLQQSCMRDILHSVIESVDGLQSADATQLLLRFLLDAGVDVNWQRKSDLYTALHVASSKNLYAIAYLLVLYGADVNAIAAVRNDDTRPRVFRYISDLANSILQDDAMPLSCAVKSMDICGTITTADREQNELLVSFLAENHARATWRKQPQKTVVASIVTDDSQRPESCSEDATDAKRPILSFSSSFGIHCNVLDRTIKMLTSSNGIRTPRVASSEQLRELVASQRPTTLLPTAKTVLRSKLLVDIDREEPHEQQHDREPVSEEKATLNHQSESNQAQEQSGEHANSIAVASKVDDPSFYSLEVRLNHTETLALWRFQAAFTDISVRPSKTVILDDLTLYGHVLRIIVTSLHPVTRIVVNTSVQFTRSPDEAAVMEGQVVELTEAEQKQHQLQMEQQLKSFWAKQLLEVHFKNHNDLPLARIKRIMKSDEDVRMISAEAPVLFAKACEMFILELTLRSWGYSEKNKRRTLQKEDIQTAIRNTDIFDFLVDVIN
ncbi:hypothetical protein BBJ28_00013386 [Nothophytophthora sp. Chile5]|nr:hypothetical protein BBJ28_00013386 [Nothophytophthora sp. Chile5]